MPKKGTISKKKPMKMKKSTNNNLDSDNQNTCDHTVMCNDSDKKSGYERNSYQSRNSQHISSLTELASIDESEPLFHHLEIKAGSTMKKSSLGSLGSNNSTTRNGGNSSNNNNAVLSLKNDNKRLAKEIKSLVLWKSPMKTLKYASLEVLFLIKTNIDRLLHQRALLFGILAVLCAIVAIILTPGQHQQVIDSFKKNGFFVVYWLGLGILSSVGLGTGLHTFLLYLGPHIASVTLAAYECSSLNFPEPPYPNEILCPDDKGSSNHIIPSLWSIMAKVRYEAFLWGAGTALGELPPYFMAKAARLSGNITEEMENLQELEKLQRRKEKGEKLNLFEKGKLFMEDIVERVGFFGILLCASIPNPLFDLAGITCGHFLVPFWKFFGATLIGKAVIKMHIQKIFVIISFNESLVDRFINFLVLIPLVGVWLQKPFKAFFESQKQRLHRNSSKHLPGTSSDGNLLASVFEYFVFAMICYFIISIINTFAQNCFKRMRKPQSHANLLDAGSYKKDN